MVLLIECIVLCILFSLGIFIPLYKKIEKEYFFDYDSFYESLKDMK